MDYNLCTISFRHEMVSFRDIAAFCLKEGFSGIELWGVHARGLHDAYPDEAAAVTREIRRSGLRISMVSDYADLLAKPDLWPQVERDWRNLLALAVYFETDKIRIFAGNKGSGAASPEEWRTGIARLRRLADAAGAYGVHTLVETHPGTFADTLESALQLLKEAGHESIKINLDFLHLWETHTTPAEALAELNPWVGNYHLKNVKSRECLDIFSPANVYFPNGRREGLASLAEGAIDYSEVVRLLLAQNAPQASASIEWFGGQPFRNIRRELIWLKDAERKCRMENLARTAIEGYRPT